MSSSDIIPSGMPSEKPPNNQPDYNNVSHQEVVNKVVFLDSQLKSHSKIIEDQNILITTLQQQLQNQSIANSNTMSTSSGISQPTMPILEPREKLPPLKEFKGNRAMWDEWHLAAMHKLAKDGAAIGDHFDQFMYIYSRLESEAAKMVSTTARTLSETGTGHGGRFLEYLNTVFGDPNKKSRAQQQLYNLKQKEREPFASFLPKFETILATAGWSSYADDQKISILKNALSREIRSSLIGRTPPTTWSEFISLLLTISSEIVALNQQFRPHLSPQQQRTVSSHSNSSEMEWETVKALTTGVHEKGSGPRATWVKKETLAFRKKKGLCIRCGHKGHIAPKCKFLPPLKPNINVNASRFLDEDQEIQELAEPEIVEPNDYQAGKEELL